MDHYDRYLIESSVKKALKEKFLNNSITEIVNMKFEDLEIEIYSSVYRIINMEDGNYEKIMDEANKIAINNFNYIMAEIGKSYNNLAYMLGCEEYK